MEMMIVLFAVFIMFAISTAIDILLFRKFYNARIIVTENNREIYEHDQKLNEIEKKLNEIQKAKE